MPDLSSILIRTSVRTLSGSGHCAACGRTPLVGEVVHEMDTGRVVCELCLAALPEEDRRAVRSERVRAIERQLPVVPKAA